MFQQKKRLRTRLSEKITTLNVMVTQHRDLAPFCSAAFLLSPYCLCPFCRAQMSWIDLSATKMLEMHCL